MSDEFSKMPSVRMSGDKSEATSGKNEEEMKSENDFPTPQSSVNEKRKKFKKSRTYSVESPMKKKSEMKKAS